MGGSRAPLVWITRALPGAAATARRVAAMGLEPVVEPLIETRALEGVRPDLDGVAALAFTSAAAVRYFAALSTERALPAFAVGDATAAALKAAGFARLESAGGDAAALAALLRTRGDSLKGAVLNPGPKAPAADLADLTEAAGVEVRPLPIYETVGRRPPGQALARVSEGAVVLVHSGRAAAALAKILAGRPNPVLVACCLSPQIARPLEGAGLSAVLAAPIPTETALLDLLDNTVRRI